ncbi:GDP-mannose mannosyl hydrolase [Vibrio vulnificus]|uniref:GDP-mannose mannosyl hydrolase n=1 Tax=Vibrio vulnificus TaxID=672 RepID=UPI000CD287CF|nr:GDP-mannose mannosyl hydrolase [Vibrio vulnificus]EIV8497165.1 GDP-mannose mannosyl hydrolase [Vibrio vulnificus]ELV8674887.1 GDP-mannose mannosyl hydrolase [Vibrio vulnificus]MCA3944887.1 GDP-mannose mannosyl hydrolase [Vibrio vulnificus]POB87977.1 GDP-mannose mannosyl hydrolase [Vibrio vulnificus]
MFLSKQRFSQVIESTPLVSIDLVIEDETGQVLLGERLNRPAQGFWFVPGGRILKNEKLEDAFARLTQEELGQEFDLSQAKLLGPYTHLYDDNVFGNEFTTHYVAIAYKLIVIRSDLNLPMDVQHSRYRWCDKYELLISDNVHTHTKWYFQNN